MRSNTTASHSTQCFPHEIYDYIIDFLWDDVMSLVQCSLVSRDFRPSAEYHLYDYKSDTMSISTRKVLTAHGRAFRRSSNSSARERFPFAHTIRITEDPRAPFTHLFPVLMVGCDVLWAKRLDLYQLDWTSIHPHNYFFDYLGHYSAVTTLQLTFCRFRSASQLRRLINALPNLETVSLEAIDGSTLKSSLASTQTPPFPVRGSAPRVNRNLRCIKLNVSPAVGIRWYPPNSMLRVAMQSVLAVCSLYQTVTELVLHIGLFDSLPCLVHFLCSFPHLNTFLLYPQNLSDDHWPVTPSVEALPTPFSYLHTLRLYDLSAAPTRDLMKLISVPHMSNTIEELDIQRVDSTEPTADLMDAVASALLRSGPALAMLTVLWACHPGTPSCLRSVFLAAHMLYNRFPSAEPSGKFIT